MELLLKNVTTVEGQVIDKLVSVDNKSKHKEMTIDFAGHFIYPGLTNWHDHLEMNLYPKLGTPPYNNYTEWMKDIYKPKESPLKEIEKTDIDYRLMWGALKNLVSGVTTVYHHNPSRRLIRKDSFPVFVPEIAWAHSLAVDKKFKYKKDRPFIIHAGEGVDELAANETTQLDKLGLLKANTYIVHGISADWDLIDRKGAAVIWCPSSNAYMFNKTADVKNRKNVFLGTDSTLTGSPTLLDEMRVASKFVSKEEVYRMVTRNSIGFFIAKKKVDNAIDNLLSLEPKDISMVVSRRRIRLQDGKPVDVDIKKLRSHFESKVGSQILSDNPLWNLI